LISFQLPTIVNLSATCLTSLQIAKEYVESILEKGDGSMKGDQQN